MVTFEAYEAICTAFADALSYPQESYSTRLTAFDTASLPRKSRKALDDFQDSVALISLSEQQELYTRTFDLSPLCSPALSVHLFGVESFKRSHLMVGLLDMYRAAGFDVCGETADHMPTVMRFLPCTSAADRQEIIHYILVPALTKMTELLRLKQNPYASLLDAVIETVSTVETTEVAYA